MKGHILILALVMTIARVAAQPAEPAVNGYAHASGAFSPDLNSLTQYRCPDWFRDAKFGIWSHWGPQAVPMMGDWYAKHMYVQGHPQYQHHLQTYGHPSTNGYKEIIQLWKAEKFDPDRLMALYKRAGARYFVSMGTHHDNFFLWNSAVHRWNAINMGPHRDIVGAWQQAAKKQGLKFGVSEHLGASFTWFQSSHGADTNGPFAGVPYDGANPAYQDLYHFPADPDDKGWYSKNPRWQRIWYESIKELVDRYQPDLLYTDGGMPFGNEMGLSLITHFYNASANRSGGQPQVVYTCKQKSEGRWIEDLERGVMSGADRNPWQTDTSIGDWYYNKNWQFRPVGWTIHMLVDIVSKNGNLLLNVVQRPDGSLDPEVERALVEMAAWIRVNGQAIYGTRPWLVYGEGPVRAKGGHFREDFAYTSQDVRFTTKGKHLYAFALGWPGDGQLLIRSLAQIEGGVSNRISRVGLLGHRGALEWSQGPEGLKVTLPALKPCSHAIALDITGRNLVPVKFSQPQPVVRPTADGTVRLLPELADLVGALQVEAQGGQPNIGLWDDSGDTATWALEGVKPGAYDLAGSFASAAGDSEIVIQVGDQKLIARLPGTGAWDRFQVTSLGRLNVGASGGFTLRAGSRDASTWKPINLRYLTLTPAKP